MNNMRDINRIPIILEELKKLWEKNPDQRLGQILENYVFFKGQRGDKTSCALFYQEDTDTLEILKDTDTLEILKKAVVGDVWFKKKEK